MAGKFTGTYGTMYYVHDMEKAVSFYKEKFGAEPSVESDEWTEFDVEGHALCFHAVEPGEKFQEGGTLIVKVKDLKKLVPALKKDGVEFISEIKEVYPGAFSAELKDPSGNTLSLYEQVFG